MEKSHNTVGSNTATKHEMIFKFLSLRNRLITRTQCNKALCM